MGAHTAETRAVPRYRNIPMQLARGGLPKALVARLGEDVVMAKSKIDSKYGARDRKCPKCHSRAKLYYRSTTNDCRCMKCGTIVKLERKF